MIRPMFGHRAKPRKFNMPLRHYNPEEDEKKAKANPYSNQKKNRHRAQNVRILIYALGLGIVVWIISIL